MSDLFLDCFSGISGDMTVGALADLGVAEDVFHQALAALALDGCHLHFHREKRKEIEGVKMDVEVGEEHSHDHGHGHHHRHSHGRSHDQIRELIGKSGLSPFVKEHSLAMFQRIAIAEGKIHGVLAAEVGFHEVGAEDSIADIVCVCAGLEALGIDRVIVSKLREGSGWIDCAHGRFPLPAPATAEILAGIPISQIAAPEELITPTGAAIVAEFGQGFDVMPEMVIDRIGYGIGTRDPADRPNILRAVLGRVTTLKDDDARADIITCIEANIDDLSPEVCGYVMEQLFDAGALDVFFVPVQMKKNRPGVMISVLCETGSEARFAEIMLTETSTLGVRMSERQRIKLARTSTVVKTKFGEVAVKIGLKDGAPVQVAPEYESCRAVSRLAGIPLRQVYQEAIKESGL